MTLLTAHDSSVICRIRLTGEGRWVSLALSLGDLDSADRFFVAAERLLYEMAGVDEAARQYGLVNWQGGVISGARYAFRALKAPIRQVCLHELRGRLGGGDVGAVSSAAALAVARLLARPEVPVDLGGWQIEEVRLPPTDGGVGEEIVSPPSEAPAERADLASGKTDADRAAQDIPAAAGPPRD